MQVGGGRTGRGPKFCFPVLDLAPSKDRKKLTDQLLSRAFIAPNALRSSGPSVAKLFTATLRVETLDKCVLSIYPVLQ